jgi:hypothetical protein
MYVTGYNVSNKCNLKLATLLKQNVLLIFFEDMHEPWCPELLAVVFWFGEGS